ncbi:MAG TPA: phosphotransferase family protein [Acidimicrobiales bacterium]|nr:phosphotransferase family protein [Acidimicrobiales bacterium]
MTDAGEMQAALEAYLAAQMPDARAVGVEDLLPIASVGNARRPWSFTVTYDVGRARHRRRCVMLLQAEAGQLESDVKIEFATLRAVEPAGVPVPHALWAERDGRVLGGPFLITELVEGTADMSLLRRSVDDPAPRAIASGLADAAARLHAIDVRTPALDHLSAVTPDRAAAAQLDHWQAIYLRQRLESLPAMAFAFDWLRAHQPVAARVSVVHGDLRFGNVLYDGDRVTALLDWEMVHLGDPVEDIAWANRSVWSLERWLSLDDFVARYEAQSGIRVDRDNLRWYRLFNEVKHGVISLTAARSFADRRTRFIRHADRASTLTAFMQRFLELLPAEEASA